MDRRPSFLRKYWVRGDGFGSWLIGDFVCFFGCFLPLRSPMSPKFSLPAPSALASDFHIFLGRKARKNEVFVNLLVWRYVLLHVKKLSQRPSGPLLCVSLLSGPHIYRSCIQSSQRHASNRINVRKSGVHWLNVEVDS